MSDYKIHDYLLVIDHVNQEGDTDDDKAEVTIEYEISLNIFMSVVVSFDNIEWQDGESDPGDISTHINPPIEEGWVVEGDGKVTAIGFSIGSQDPTPYQVEGLPPAFCQALIKLAKKKAEGQDPPEYAP